MSVYFDGVTLSGLFFSYLGGGSQHGFLFGEKIEEKQDRISDSQITSSDVSSYIYVTSHLPWPRQNSLFNRGGLIDDGLMKSLLSSREQTLVGWYCFRPNTPPRPSFVETNWHNRLSRSISGSPEDFIFFLCTASFHGNKSAHTYIYSVMHYTHHCFTNLSLTTVNLGYTTRKEYRKRSSATLSHSKTISGKFESFQHSFVRSSGEAEYLREVNCLSSSLNEELMGVQNKITESEVIIGSLEGDVANLRKQIRLFELEEVAMVFSTEDNIKTKEAQEKRKRNEDKDVEEEEHLEKLLSKLDMSSKDSNHNASINYNLQPVSVMFTNCSNFESTGNVQSKNTNHSLNSECTFINSNTDFTVKNTSTTRTELFSPLTFEQKTLDSGATQKHNMSDMGDEFRSKQHVPTPLCSSSYAYSSLGLDRGDLKKFTVNADESSQCQEGFNAQSSSKETKLVDRVHRSATLKKKIEEEGGRETAQSDGHTNGDRVTLSSSPVF